MWSRTPQKFDDLRARERELNTKQREILGLIEKGHTNREIAELLDLSVDGAKWNVSEILTKLGLDSREEAAEYWRWRKSRTPAVVRSMRALFGLPAVKWTAGSVAVVGVAGMGVLAALGGGAEPELVPDPPAHEFYVEATVHTADPERPTNHVLRWWHRDADHVRWDFDQVSPPIESTFRTWVVDGGSKYEFDRNGSNYRTTAVGGAWGVVRQPEDIVFIGPSPYADLTSLLEGLSKWGDGSIPAVLTGHERVNGFSAAVITYLSGTVWLDESKMLIVRHHSDRFRADLTKYEERAIANSEVAFDPSVAARPTVTPWPTAPNPADTIARSHARDAEDLRPTYLPGAIQMRIGGRRGYETYSVSEMVCMSEAQMMANQRLPGTPLLHGEYVRIEQRGGLVELPEGLRQGNTVRVRGVTGWASISGPLAILSWQEPDGRVLRMEGSQVGLDELLKVAEGLLPGPQSP